MPDNVSMGTNFHTRNSPPLVNASFYQWTNWGGRFAAQWELPLVVVESPIIMNGNRLKLAHRIFDVYKAEYEPSSPRDARSGARQSTTRFPSRRQARCPPPLRQPDPPDGPWEGMTDGDR